MARIRLTWRCMSSIICEALDHNIKIVVVYIAILLCSECIVGFSMYILSIVMSDAGTDCRGLMLNFGVLVTYFVPSIMYVCIACMLRRYWPFYISLLTVFIVWAAVLTSRAVAVDPASYHWFALFGTLTRTSTLMVGVPAVVFFTLCKLAGLPLPQSRGWAACINKQHDGISRP